MANTMIFDESRVDLERCRAERDALAKRVEETEDVLYELVAAVHRRTDACPDEHEAAVLQFEQKWEAAWKLARTIATRRAGRAS